MGYMVMVVQWFGGRRGSVGKKLRALGWWFPWWVRRFWRLRKKSWMDG